MYSSFALYRSQLKPPHYPQTKEQKPSERWTFLSATRSRGKGRPQTSSKDERPLRASRSF